jgi:hypothetical protein
LRLDGVALSLKQAAERLLYGRIVLDHEDASDRFDSAGWIHGSNGIEWSSKVTHKNYLPANRGRLPVPEMPHPEATRLLKLTTVYR